MSGKRGTQDDSRGLPGEGQSDEVKKNAAVADYIAMQGLASPGDFMNAILDSRRIESRSAEALRAVKGRKVPASVEDLLLSDKADYLRPESAIMNAMDASRDADEERRTGRKKSVFDDLLSSKVAAAVGVIYPSNPGEGDPRLDLTQEDPLSAAQAIGNIRPRLGGKALEIAREHGFPMEIFAGGSRDPISVLQRSLTAQNPSASPQLERAMARIKSRFGAVRIARGLSD